MDLDARGHGTAHQQVEVGIPRDGGIADLLAEAARPEPRFAAVMCENIERSGRDTFYALRLEKQLSGAQIPLLATDEPIDVNGMNATTLLVRRVKQGIAEWYRFQLKDAAWKGLREHALAGFNIGSVPYGYLAQRVPHPVPALLRLCDDLPPALATSLSHLERNTGRQKSSVIMAGFRVLVIGK